MPLCEPCHRAGFFGQQRKDRSGQQPMQANIEPEPLRKRLTNSCRGTGI